MGALHLTLTLWRTPSGAHPRAHTLTVTPSGVHHRALTIWRSPSGAYNWELTILHPPSSAHPQALIIGRLHSCAQSRAQTLGRTPSARTLGCSLLGAHQWTHAKWLTPSGGHHRAPILVSRTHTIRCSPPRAHLQAEPAVATAYTEYLLVSRPCYRLLLTESATGRRVF